LVKLIGLTLNSNQMVKNDSEKQTEEKIFEAAMAVFEEKGFAAARMQEIADRAGINKSLLHYYFRSKDQLFEVVFNKLFEKMFSMVIGIFMSDKPFEEKIREYYCEHIRFFQQNPMLPIFIMSEISHNPERLKKRFGNIDYTKIRDSVMGFHAEEMSEYGIKKEDWVQFMITVVSLTIFPFAAKEIVKMFLDQTGYTKGFDDFMNERKVFASEFVINAIKHMNKK